MPITRAAAGVLAPAILVLLAACTRPVAVESEPGPAYTLVVENPMPHDMIVSYRAGATTPSLLGTVPANGRERFIITGAATRMITVLATNEAQTHTVNMPVVLRAGAETEVRLTM